MINKTLANKTYYQILGVSPDVSTLEIKRAYRKLAKIQHPDLKQNNRNKRKQKSATEEMMQLNEAYATLMDKNKRAKYDAIIGVSQGVRIQAAAYSSLNEHEQREQYLRQVFHPCRLAISEILRMYKGQMKKLSLDPFDEELIAAFQNYADKVEAVLLQGSGTLTKAKTPASLQAAVHMMRYAIAQAADGLDEMRHFGSNFDYDHLAMAGNLFRIATELFKQALNLTKC